MRIKLSIIIATFNSEKTLPLVLKTLRNQTFPEKEMEILLVDGGSTDATKSIGKDFTCKIINNPQTEPVYAKYLGYLHAKGDYIVYLDHDEVIEQKDSLEKKYNIFLRNKNVHAVIGSGYKNPKGYAFINNYINEFGDPFSFFIYRLSKDAHFFIPEMRKRYKIVSEDKNSIIFSFSNLTLLPIIELCAAAGMIDLQYMKKNFPETMKKPQLIPHFFYLLIKNSHIALAKNDALMHYSSDTLSKYFNKIRWRVKNNIYHIDRIGQAGFSGREEYQPAYIRLRKFLFIPYAFTLVFLLIDTFYLMITRKKLLYILHTPLTLFTACLIVYHYTRKLLGANEMLKSYDESVIIK